MSRELTPRSSIEGLRKEAKRWLRALRENDAEAIARLRRAHPNAPDTPGIRDVQHALAREHGLPGWSALRAELERRAAARPLPTERSAAIEALLAGAERGDAALVAALLDARPDIVNERAVLEGHTGRRTALHFAVNRDSTAVVALLLERGADPNIRDEGDNAMPLHFAAEHGAIDVVRLLVEHGADPIGSGDHHELDVIGWATVFARVPSAELVEYLLAHGARHNISSAVATGVTDAIREIAARAPAELDRPMDATNHRRRPLHLAVVRGQASSLATLLELGANVELEDAAGLTPLDQAALSGERAMAGVLIEHGARVRLPAAVALERLADVERLLSEEPHSLRPGGRWDRLLIRAAEHGSAKVIHALIDRGASVHARDDHRTAVDGTHGYTALHAAAFNGNIEAVRALLARGANPADREDRYWGTPAGWANHAGHAEVRDVILEGAIDIFDAITFDRHDRIPDILTRDPLALERRFVEYVNGDAKSHPWIDPAWTPVAFALAHGKLRAAHLLAERGADLTMRDSAGRTLAELAAAGGHPELADFLSRSAAVFAPRTGAFGSFDELVADFLHKACLDWRVGGSQRATWTQDAGRLLERNPELARASIYTAVACGELDEVRRILDERPEAANEIGGPRSWPPLLYLCSARLPQPAASESSVAIARLLLDRGADPNAFYLGGNADIHYTAFTCVMGRGEELAAVHPRARELVALLLERGADPHDNQVLYNVFADNTSRHLLDDDLVWLLELMHEHSLRRGHRAAWADPLWPMFDMRGAPSLGHDDRVHHGARFMLDAAVDRNLLRMAEWMLSHGASPDAPAGRLWKGRTRTLYQDAVARGHDEMAALLARHGASTLLSKVEGYEMLVDACARGDREEIVALLERHPGYVADPRAMHEALKRDRMEVIQLLLDHGVSPAITDPASGTSALHVAASADALHSAALLLERGADVDVRDRLYDSPPLGWAAYFQHARMIELLGAHSRDVWYLAHTGRVDRLREVLAEEPERARVVGKDGDTPLMWLPADTASALAIAKLFLEHGADAARLNARGDSAAALAERRGLDEVAALLAR
jgi:ankyrin repeat protein